MNNFEFCNPVKVVFGKGSIARLSALIPEGSRVLMVYGGGSIKKNGIYDQVTKALESFVVTGISRYRSKSALRNLYEGRGDRQREEDRFSVGRRRWFGDRCNKVHRSICRVSKVIRGISFRKAGR